MRIYTRAGDLAFKTFTYPDGQPHFELETYERDFSSATIETAFKSPLDIFQTSLAVDVLRNNGYSEVNLDVRYLLGARMDRAINTMQPHTLQSVARSINSMGLNRVRILDVHSEVATRLIRNSSNILPDKVAHQVYETLGNPTVVCPDKGASDRVDRLFGWTEWLQCYKKRDPSTGVLSGFELHYKDAFKDNPLPSKFNCLIVDDICDGGGTFVGLAKELRKAGAKKVYLYVTHGIFSKGLPIEGIDHVYTTDSYVERLGDVYKHFHSFCRGSVIPISMKDL